MKFQLTIVLLFGLNLLLAWSNGKARRLATIIFVSLPLLSVFPAQPRFELDYFWWRLAGAAAVLLGLALIAWSQKTLGKTIPLVAEGTKTLVVSGPYQFVRQPIYLGLIFIFTGWWWLWSAVYAFYFGLFMLALIWLEGYLEERFILLKNFGEKYTVYRRQTGLFWIK